MNRVKNFATRNAVAISTGAGVVLASVVAFVTASGATGLTTLETTFSSTQSQLVTELGYGVALVVALLLIGLGVRMLVKWSRHGVKSS